MVLHSNFARGSANLLQAEVCSLARPHYVPQYPHTTHLIRYNGFVPDKTIGSDFNPDGINKLIKNIIKPGGGRFGMFGIARCAQGNDEKRK